MVIIVAPEACGGGEVTRTTFDAGLANTFAPAIFAVAAILLEEKIPLEIFRPA